MSTAHEICRASVYMDILCLRTSEQISALKYEYQARHDKTAEEDAEEISDKHLRALVIALLQGCRDPSSQVDQQKAEEVCFLMSFLYSKQLLYKFMKVS